MSWKGDGFMQPTQNRITCGPAQPVDAETVAFTLRDAAKYLRLYGWIQGAYFDTDTDPFKPPACTVGAIAMVCYGHPYEAPAQRFGQHGHNEFEATVSYLDQILKDTYGQDDVYTWNDDRARTVGEVIRVLHQVADDYGHADYPHQPGALYE